MFRPTSHDGSPAYEEYMAVRTAQRALDLVGRAIHSFEGFIKASVVTSVCAKLSSLCEVCPSLILDLSELALEVAAGVTEGSSPHKTTPEQGGSGGLISSSPAAPGSPGCSRKTSLCFSL